MSAFWEGQGRLEALSAIYSWTVVIQATRGVLLEISCRLTEREPRPCRQMVSQNVSMMD